MKKYFLLLIIVAFIGNFIFYKKICKYPTIYPDQNLSNTKIQMIIMFKSFKKVKNSLEKISEDFYKTSCVDGWGKPIFYSKKNNSFLSLKTTKKNYSDEDLLKLCIVNFKFPNESFKSLSALDPVFEECFNDGDNIYKNINLDTFNPDNELLNKILLWSIRKNKFLIFTSLIKQKPLIHDDLINSCYVYERIDFLEFLNKLNYEIFIAGKGNRRSSIAYLYKGGTIESLRTANVDKESFIKHKKNLILKLNTILAYKVNNCEKVCDYQKQAYLEAAIELRNNFLVELALNSVMMVDKLLYEKLLSIENPKITSILKSKGIHFDLKYVRRIRKSKHNN